MEGGVVAGVRVSGRCLLTVGKAWAQALRDGEGDSGLEFLHCSFQ